VGHAVLYVVCHVERRVLWETLHARSDVDAPSSAASVRGHCRSRYNAIVAISSGGATLRTTRAWNATCCTTSAQARRKRQHATCNIQHTAGAVRALASANSSVVGASEAPKNELNLRVRVGGRKEWRALAHSG
jgi:hypothetical protein